MTSAVRSISLVLDLMLSAYVVALGVAMVRAIFKFGGRHIPGPLALIAMAWRGEIRVQDKTE